LAEFLAQPETQPPREYRHGYIDQKPMPKGKHSAIQSTLTAEINYQKKNVRAFSELRCTLGDRSIVPDISVFQTDRIPRDSAGDIADDFCLAPDWLIEILSPEQSSIRVIDKILFCLAQGTRVGWLIEPRDRLILSFGPHHSPQTHEGQAQPPILPQLDPWQPTVDDIFACLTV
jgi:Uma2 family endonuclease